MLNILNVPNLKNIGGTLSLVGQKNVNEENFPSLETIGGDIHLALSGFTKLPDNLISIEGDVYIINEPETLAKSCIAKKKSGVIKGNIYLVGGNISTNDEGKIDYAEKLLLNNFS